MFAQVNFFFEKVILKHFYLRKKETLLQCEQWRKELVAGMKALRSQGANVTMVMDYMKTLLKQTDSLKTQLAKIDLSQFKDNEEIT